MASLDDLARMDGVLVAFEFTADGKLRDHKASREVPAEMAAMAAQFCATVTMMFDTLAGAFTRLSNMSWVPQRSWSYSGGEWTVVIGGHRGVFVQAGKADVNRLAEALA